MNPEFETAAAHLQELSALLRLRNWRITAAESCTGGLLSALFTEQAGSSEWFQSSVVCYSNAAKTQLLDVPETMLAQHGAVSTQVACAMVSGVQILSNADVAVGITGIAGPGGGTETKPVGTVCIGWKIAAAKAEAEHFLFSGDRHAVRVAAVHAAVQGALERLHR